jgi:hypothetical protein
VSDGKRAEINSPFRPLPADERARVEEQMRTTYELFVSRVATGRRSSREKMMRWDRAGSGRAIRRSSAAWSMNWAAWAGHSARQGTREARRDQGRRPRRVPAETVSLRSLLEPDHTGLTAAGAGANLLFRRPEMRALDAAGAAINRFRRGEMLALMPNVFVR